MARDFFDAQGAAEELATRSGGKHKWTAAQVHRAAEDGSLPVCFQFQGKLGVFDRLGDLGTLTFGKAKRSEYFPQGGYLRACGGLILGGQVHHLRGPISKVDNLRLGAVEIVKAARGFNASIGVALESSEVLYILSESTLWNGCKDHTRTVPVSEWLFHTDDLAKLTASDVFRGGVGVQTGVMDEGALKPPVDSKRWTLEALAEMAKYRDEHGSMQAAAHFGISGARLRQLLPRETKAHSNLFPGKRNHSR